MIEVRQQIFPLDSFTENESHTGYAPQSIIVGDGLVITKLGVQAPAGTELIIDGHNIIVGRNGIWELPYGIKIKSFKCKPQENYSISYGALNTIRYETALSRAQTELNNAKTAVAENEDSSQEGNIMANERSNYLATLDELLQAGAIYYASLQGVASFEPGTQNVVMDRIIVDYVVESETTTREETADE